MTLKYLSGVTLALLLGVCPLSNAQEVPAGYTSIDQYGQSDAVKVEEVKPAVPLDQQNLTYVVEPGASFRDTLESWLTRVEWQKLAWKLPPDTDFTLGARAEFTGDFVTVTKKFVNSLGSEAKFNVHFKKGNRLLVVEPGQ